MLDAGGGGGYGGTNWSAVSVIDMWLAIGNQETTPHWQLLSGWRKSYELTQQHMGQVKNYRDNLAAAWPPEKSPAAAAYIARLDELITHLQNTYEAALANYTAFSNATLALSSARTDLDKVVNEYLANEGKLATFEQEQADRPKGGLQRGQPPKPPVADGRQAQLEAQARSIMYSLSSELSQARAQVAQPVRYSPDLARGDDERSVGGSTYNAPVIPPVVPFDPTQGGTHPTSSGAPPAAIPSTSSNVANPSRVPGLILGGIEPPLPPTPPPTNVSPPVVGSPPVTIHPSPGPLPPAVGPSLPPTQATPHGRPLPGGGSVRPNLMNPPAGGIRPLPPGGVIGGLPGTGLAQPTTGNRAAPHVNPVGGLLSPGGNPARGGSAGRAPGMPGQPIAPLSGRSHGIHEEKTEGHRWDPDNPWETSEGVAPVVLPTAETRVDPGPAIGLR